jgi:uncharacterized SAM-binding protein YcdF (DUF218 family)
MNNASGPLRRSAGYRDWLLSISFVLLLTMVVPLTATSLLSGKSVAEKMLTCMAQPLFIAIVCVLAIGMVLYRRGELAIARLLIAGALGMWIVSTPLLVNGLVKAWEVDWQGAVQADQPFDYVVVLGGGTSVAPDGRAQWGDAGDRIGYAARLYLTGKARNLVTTGDVLVVTGTLTGRLEPKDDPSEQTRQIWSDLGIPDEVVFELPGQNTYSEIAALKQHPEWWQEKRCGLLTSAFHMSRAMKLAEQAGVRVTPIPADFRAGYGPMTINALIPNAGELRRIQMLVTEWLAMHIGR